MSYLHSQLVRHELLPRAFSERRRRRDLQAPPGLATDRRIDTERSRQHGLHPGYVRCAIAAVFASLRRYLPRARWTTTSSSCSPAQVGLPHEPAPLTLCTLPQRPSISRASPARPRANRRRRAQRHTRPFLRIGQQRRARPALRAGQQRAELQLLQSTLGSARLQP